MQFYIQLIIACTIDQTQGLTFDHLTFGPNGTYKHASTFITLSHIKNKNKKQKKKTSFNFYKWFFFKLS